MPCFHPLLAWYAKGVNPTGKRSLTFKESNAYDGPDEKYKVRLEVPCGQCIGCRLDRSRNWAIRCLHEASLYENNCFITLTYDNDHLPSDLSLNKKDLQKFFKRLRRYLDHHENSLPIRYFACGEYGDSTNRAHYHACVFNYSFPDRELWSVRDGIRLYTSETLNTIWGKGYCVIGDVTFDSAAYVARYVMKKQTGKQSKLKYQFVDDSTGEIHQVEPEFNLMSRRPGIGREWFEKFKGDCYPKDFINVNGKEVKPPKYYDRLYDLESPEEMEAIKLNRVEYAKTHAENNTGERLATREQLQKLRAKMLVRTVE